MDCSSDFEVMRMQLLQMNLLKLLVALDCFILLCIWYYAREEKYYPVQNVWQLFYDCLHFIINIVRKM